MHTMTQTKKFFVPIVFFVILVLRSRRRVAASQWLSSNA
jgi:hypothetical protein